MNIVVYHSNGSPKKYDHNKLYNLVENDGFVYCEVRKGMYGLKQAARLAFDRLVIKLAPIGYHPVPQSPGFWVHDTRPTVFTLCVDDFGVKYSTKEDANHFLSALTSNYRISINWKGDNYVGLTLKWNYHDGYVDLSMPNYIKNALTRLRHKPPTTKQYSLHDWIRPSYGSKIQYANDPPDLPQLNKDQTLHIQTVTGILLYYVRAIDSTMLPALLEIAREQAKPTETTMKKYNRLLDYATTYPEATLRYRKSDMVLHVDTDAAYLVLPGARSRYGTKI